MAVQHEAGPALLAVINEAVAQSPLVRAAVAGVIDGLGESTEGGFIIKVTAAILQSQ